MAKLIKTHEGFVMAPAVAVVRIVRGMIPGFDHEDGSSVRYWIELRGPTGQTLGRIACRKESDTGRHVELIAELIEREVA